MKTFLPRRTVFVLAFSLIAAGLPLRAATDHQPRMQSAIELLEGAKVAEDPVPLLKDARKQLANAAHNKGGRRVQGIEEVNEAIEAAKAGDKTKTINKINHAIAVVRSGMDRGRK